MGRDKFDSQIEGQITLEEVLGPPQRLIAVSMVFARARKEMSLAEQKTFVYALAQLRFKEEAKTLYVRLDKKKLANVLGIHSDPDHLSVDVFDNIKELPRHSYIEFADRDRDFYTSGLLVTSIVSFKNIVRLRFNEDYISLFTGLSTQYITLWSEDIFRMTSKRSVQFYEFLRQNTDTRQRVQDIGLGVKALKDMFSIPKAGKGSYMRSKGGFNRTEFEKKVIEPLCEDLKNCKMIQLILQQNGKYYEKVKRGNRVEGYRFYWTFSAYPAVADASEIREIQEKIDKDPKVLKVAKDIIEGEKRTKKRVKKENTFNNFEQRNYEKEMPNLENILLGIE